MKLKELLNEGYLIETPTEYLIDKPFTITKPITLDKTLVSPPGWTMETSKSYTKFYKSKEQQSQESVNHD